MITGIFNFASKYFYPSRSTTQKPFSLVKEICFLVFDSLNNSDLSNFAQTRKCNAQIIAEYKHFRLKKFALSLNLHSINVRIKNHEFTFNSPSSNFPAYSHLITSCVLAEGTRFFKTAQFQKFVKKEPPPQNIAAIFRRFLNKKPLLKTRWDSPLFHINDVRKIAAYYRLLEFTNLGLMGQNLAPLPQAMNHEIKVLKEEPEALIQWAFEFFRDNMSRTPGFNLLITVPVIHNALCLISTTEKVSNSTRLANSIIDLTTWDQVFIYSHLYSRELLSCLLNLHYQKIEVLNHLKSKPQWRPYMLELALEIDASDDLFEKAISTRVKSAPICEWSTLILLIKYYNRDLKKMDEIWSVFITHGKAERDVVDLAFIEIFFQHVENKVKFAKQIQQSTAIFQNPILHSQLQALLNE